MKNKKKGFTLIELLAVILILAIIALIAVPVVLNLIEKSRKGAAQDSAYGLRKAAQLYYTSALLENVDGGDITFNCDEVNGCISEDNKVKLDIDGTKPSNGKIEIKSDGEIIYSDIVINGYACEIKNSGSIKCKKSGEETIPTDKTAPILTLGEVITNANGITISYTVDDEDATITCEYGVDENYGNVGTIENGTCVISELTTGTEYFFKLIANDQSNNSSEPLIGSAIAEPIKYVSGDAVTLGGYNWHVISDDGQYVTLLMDKGQINNMKHCSADTDTSTDCGVYAGSYTYSWDKSLVRTYLNNTLYPELLDKIDNIVSTEICADRSMSNGVTTSYGGYLISELDALGLSSSCTTIVKDYVRLITYSEHYNLDPKNSANPNYPNVNGITRLSVDSDYSDWLYSLSIGSWWTMGSTTNNNISSAHIVNFAGSLFTDEAEEFHVVRPVITIKK